MALRAAGAILFGALVGSVGSGVGTRAEAPQPAPPKIVVTADPYPDDAFVTGATFKVEGSDWPANTLVQLEVCGNQARSGSADCVVTGAQIVGADSNGTFRARVAVTPPPTPCPCVVRAMSQGGDGIATAVVRIPGAPELLPGDGTVASPALRRLEVSGVALEGSGPWQAWFGGHPKRTLVFTVANTGTAIVGNAVLSLTVGTSDDPTGFVKPVPLGTIKVGERKSFRIPVEFDVLSFRTQVVKGSISGTSHDATFAARTTAFPWLLVVIPGLVLLQLILVVGRNVLRRRLHARSPATSGAVTAAAVAEPVAATNAEPAQAVVPEAVEAAVPEPVDATDADGYPADHLVCVIELSEGPVWGRALELCDVAGDRLLDSYSDDPLNRTNLAVLGLDTAKLVALHATDMANRPGEVGVHGAVGLVRRISILALGGITQKQAQQACADLARWIVGTLGVQVLIEGSVSDSGLDETGPAPHELRLHAGTATMYFRVQLTEYVVYDVARLLQGLQSGDITASTSASGQGSKIYIRLADTDRIGPVEVYDMFADRAHVGRFEPIGPIPLAVLGRVAPERWAQLGFDPDRTFESLAARASRRVSGEVSVLSALMLDRPGSSSGQS